MSRRFGGIWLSLGDLNRGDQLRYIVERGSGAFTVGIPSDLLGEGASTLAFVTAKEGQLDYLGVVTGGKKLTDFDRKIQIGPLIALPEIAIDSIREATPKNVKVHVRQPNRRAATVPPKTWGAMLDLLVESGRVERKQLQYLATHLDLRSNELLGEIPQTLGLERDAFATAFELFGGSTARKAYISASTPTADAPFIHALRHQDIFAIEDQIIQHDALSFPGAQSLLPHLVGAVRVETRAGSLTIVNANRTRVERTLGVDLVYYNHQHDAFVMVQYKRLSDDPNDPIYRPNLDRNIARELARMRRFDQSSSQRDMSCETYRLIKSPFFLKLCKSRTPGGWNGRMLSGMYFPLPLWDLLMQSPTVEGPRGGRSVGFNNAPRRFTNSQFTRLLRDGWLGTSGKDTQRVNEILVNQLTAGHSVIAAYHQPSRESRDYARDNYGRFAGDGDETAI